MTWVTHVFGLTILYILFITYDVTAQSIDDLLRLNNYLERRNPKKLRPIKNQSQPLNVYIDFYLLNIIGLDDVQQNLHVSVVFNMSWKDDLLSWNESEFGGIKSYVPSSDILWMPALSCFKYVGKMNIFEDSWQRVRVHSDGIVVWQVQKSLNLICPLNMQYFPNDNQTCELLFYTLQYTSDEVILLSNSHKGRNNLYDSSNGEWELNAVITRTELYQTDHSSQIVLFIVTIKIDRLYNFFLQNVIIPIFMLSFLNLFTFCLPDDSGEKISFSLTVLLSQTVFLSTISESLPTTSLHLAYITIYMNCLLIISCSISIASIVLLYFHHHRKKLEKLSKNESSKEPRVQDTFKSAKIHPMPSAQNQSFKKSSRFRCFSCTVDTMLFIIFFSVWLLITVVFIITIIFKNNITGFPEFDNSSGNRKTF
ncbi:hypothetical protein SNE40_016801 [Patella caerulea]|uniref:Uncharacterized protein n=1 Tax=Patella caerulea TaxID=87958 RepID=A0AAN8JFE8_PATCE